MAPRFPDSVQARIYDALGRITRAKDHDSIALFTYDSLSRVLTEKQGDNPFGTSAKTVSTTYDSGGNSTQIDYPSGFEAHRTFDALSRLTAVDDGNAADVADWDLYGAARRRDVVTFGNSATATYTYDGFRRPTDISHETSTPAEFASFSYGWTASRSPRSARGGERQPAP